MHYSIQCLQACFLKAMEILTELNINITVITTYFTVNIFKLMLFRIKFLEK